MKNVTVVVPVYGDWESLNECIDSLLSTIDDRHTVIFVNDCGPDVEIMEKNIKLKINDRPNFAYYRNMRNLGFVGTCNRAVEELDTSENDILLLNSDTKVTGKFPEEMIEVLYEDTSHATVTPRSNNATLATIPLREGANKGIDREESYRLYKRILNKLPRWYEAPTAHGFCMLIRRSVIKQYGLFDSTFGSGYGEEVDFSRRLINKGYACIIANHSYVFHLEARSFTPERKKILLERNNKIIWDRYPDYRSEVRVYMNETIKAEDLLEMNYVGRFFNRVIAKLKTIAR